MSLNLGYWPEGKMPVRGPCAGDRFHVQNREGPIRLPGRFETSGDVKYCADTSLELDHFARAALETMRDSYNPLPTASVGEFRSFFSAANFQHLFDQIKLRSGGSDIDRSDLFEAMMACWAMVAPRTELMDVDRRLNFSPQTTKSYVDEINALVLDRTVEEVRQANRLWDYFAKNRNGPSELVEHFDTDTRSRWTASFFPGDWYLPDD
jgi:hypothetical protein